MKYTDDQLLMLSGIQHFSFCRRQWALIHIEKQWKENERTIEGKILHQRSDDPFIVETRGNIIISRAVPLVSYEIGLYGVADVIEFISVKDTGIKLKGQEGLWQPVPIEYKRGKPKNDERDEVQLCAQAICLEEMLDTSIEEAYIFYDAIKRRNKIALDNTLRKKVKEISFDMHIMFRAGKTPRAEYAKKCNLCSMKEICQPKLFRKKMKVSDYIKGVTEDI